MQQRWTRFDPRRPAAARHGGAARQVALPGRVAAAPPCRAPCGIWR